MTTVGRPRGQGRLERSATNGSADLSGGRGQRDQSMSAVNLWRPTALSTKAAPRKGEVPYSPSAEYALLGAVMLDEWECWGEEVEKIVTAEDFFFPEHQAIWRAMRWLFANGDPVTVPTVAYAMEQMGVIDACDAWLGPPYTEPYLVELCAHTWSAIGCAAFARIVKHYSDMRSTPSRYRREIEID